MIATYRLQFHAGFTLADATRRLDYFARLGVSHLYASPLLQARRGSTHGYDVTDPTRLNPELGTLAAWNDFITQLHARGLRLLLDIVPNHMAASLENPWWRSVLTLGPQSPYATWFDINWHANGRVVLPVLGTTLAHALRHGKFSLHHDPLGPTLHYAGQRFPLAPRTRLDAPLPRILAQQFYILRPWRSANQEINYRRFFAINDLVGFRVEDPAAFAASHALIAAWLRSGAVDALRVDHIDGLQQPAAYLRQLQALFPGGQGTVLVEKILADGEALPPDWPVAGATGYEFLAPLDRAALAPDGHAAIVGFYRGFIRRATDFPTVVHGKKRQVIRSLFAGEMRGLGRCLAALGVALHLDSAPAPLDPRRATRLLSEIAACMPVYRTYAAQGPMRARERDQLATAAAAAVRRNPDLPPPLLQWAAWVLSLDPRAALPASQHPAWHSLVLRWQQYTAPIMAKGQEDTAFYVYYPLAALDEVGNDPARGPLSVNDFHAILRARQAAMPAGLNALSTHDTKRSADVRARLDILTAMPRLWRAAVLRWSRLNCPHHVLVGRRPVPDRNLEYHLYQTLVGAWPLDPARLAAYALKAAREAKLETRWTAPNAAYESALAAFVHAILDPARAPEFLRDLAAFVAHLAPGAALLSLVHLTLQVLAPGVPDIYQGDELWNFSLVDPDNRRPVDFDRRASLLALPATDLPTLLADWSGDRLKIELLQRLLRIRAQHAALCAAGAYTPLTARGPGAPRCFAFLRQYQNAALCVVLPHLFQGPGAFDWRATRLALPHDLAPRWVNLLTGETENSDADHHLPLDRLFRRFPIAVLQLAP